MQRSVYAVLFTNGGLKVGSAKNVILSMQKVIGGGRLFGQDVEVLFFTELHEGAEKSERKVLAFCKGVAESHGDGAFTGCDYQMARKAMLKTGKLIAWTRELATIGNKVIVSLDDGESKSADSSEALKIRIGKVLSDANGEMTEGKLQNRIRGRDLREALTSLEAIGKIRREITHHPVNGKEIHTFFLA